MKKFLISIICALCVCSAFASGENVATSKAFVDTAVAQKQDKIPANTNPNNSPDQVLTNTGTAGSVGTKDVYDSSAAYTDQTDSLIDAATMNAAVQNAIDAEFKCVQYNPNDPNDCWLVDILGTTAEQSNLPTGYTELEYIEGGVIDTGLYIKTTDIYEFKYSIPDRHTAYQFGYRGTDGFASPNTFNGTYYGAPNGVLYIVDAQSRDKRFFYDIPVNTPFVFRWNGSVNINPTVSGNGISSDGSTTEQTNPSQTFMLGGQFINGKVQMHKPIKLYYFKTFDNNGITVTHNFIPVRRDSDGVLGMYDTKTNTFLTNAATGEFTAGPVTNLYIPSRN